MKSSTNQQLCLKCNVPFKFLMAPNVEADLMYCSCPFVCSFGVNAGIASYFSCYCRFCIGSDRGMSLYL